jgi:hypothetical protein
MLYLNYLSNRKSRYLTHYVFYELAKTCKTYDILQAFCAKPQFVSKLLNISSKNCKQNRMQIY